MNSPTWTYPLTSFYPPTSFYSYPNPMVHPSIQTSLNSSSGYESGVNETSFIDSCYTTSSFPLQEANLIQDDSDSNMSIEKNDPVRKKRRILSRPQRQEANRRERERMEIINQAYEQLRNALPFKKGRKRQKMSRMDTVDGAIRYIHSLLETLHGPNYNPEWAK